MDFLEHNSHNSQNMLPEHFIADMKSHYDKNRQYADWREQPHSSNRSPAREGIDDWLENMIRDVEENRTRAYGTPGMCQSFNIDNNFVHSAMVDETYMLVGSRLKDSLIRKIENGEYVDFSKLIPRDKISAESE